jgi:hypothetical protein
MSLQLRQYDTIPDSGTEAPAVAPPAVPLRPTARDILGLNRVRNRGAPQDAVEVEAAAYLRDAQPATKSLIYWQVCNVNFK